MSAARLAYRRSIENGMERPTLRGADRCCTSVGRHQMSPAGLGDTAGGSCGKVTRMRTTRRHTGREILIGVAAALVVLAACDGGDDAPRIDEPTTSTGAREAHALEVATGFVEAFGAFDAEGAVAYLADGAEVPEGLRAEELAVLVSFFEAQGYEQMLDPCEVTGTSRIGTGVRCPYDFHAIRSDEIGLGPFHGSSWSITVRDGKIVRALQEWEDQEFSSQIWEPFAQWVYANYPKHFEVMYVGDAINFHLSEASIRLWERHSREYVEDVTR